MLESYFEPFRKKILGYDYEFETPFGKKRLLYADWTASGRAYGPLERRMLEEIAPLIANTHSEMSVTGSAMTKAYETAKQVIKDHVHAGPADVLIFAGSGMTGAVNKFQRLLGLRIPERFMDYVDGTTSVHAPSGEAAGTTVQQLISGYLRLDPKLKPLVFVSQMEHHSNQTSWIETIADVEIIPNERGGSIDTGALEKLLQTYAARPNKMAAITACSNVTGVQTPYHEVARLMHAYGGLCFVDFACSAPYIRIDMHPPKDPEARLDAIYFSPHKFLGGQGTPGVLIFNRSLYHNLVPDQPGGGTVIYTNPWRYHEFVTDIEQREDGGTPPFLQGIKAALAVRLKEEMGVEKLLQREAWLVERMTNRLNKIKGIRLLEPEVNHRLGVFSFVAENLHYNLFVRLLNDRFGVQARGGCACAGTYGHALLEVDPGRSYAILEEIHKGHLFCKPGWVRVSVHPVMSDAEVDQLLHAIEEIAAKGSDWATDYQYEESSNSFRHVNFEDPVIETVRNWYN